MTWDTDDQANVGVDSTDSDLYTHECQWQGDRTNRPSQVVVTTVARATERSPAELRPLFEVVDPDALDSLFEYNANRSADAVNGTIAFEYEGCEVRVESDGRIVVKTVETDD